MPGRAPRSPICRTSIAGDQRNVALVQAALDAGSATRTQLAERAEPAWRPTAPCCPISAKQEAVSRHALAVLAGTAGRQAGPCRTWRWTISPCPTEIPAGLPSDLIHQRPDILAAEAQLHMASAAIGIATANLYPQITLSATLTRQALTPDSLFSGTPNIWNIAAGLTAAAVQWRRPERRAPRRDRCLSGGAGGL